jgi:hypothetical protein
LVVRQIQQIKRGFVLGAAWKWALQSSAIQVSKAVVHGTPVEVVRSQSTPALVMQEEMKAKTDVAV